MADKEYIEREALLKMPPFTKFGGQPNEYNDGYLDCAADARKAIRSAPTADVVEVRHGYWIKVTSYPMGYKCHECGYFKIYKKPYCEICGAKMDGKGEGE